MEMETWKHGEMETWKYGDTETFRHVDMETWRHGDMDMETWTWRHGHGDMDMETWTWRHRDIKWKTEGQAIFLNPFTVCSSWKRKFCGEPVISHDSYHVSLVQWTNLFASRHKGHRFKSPGGTYVKPGFSC
jgi:hypothetical protein